MNAETSEINNVLSSIKQVVEGKPSKDALLLTDMIDEETHDIVSVETLDETSQETQVKEDKEQDSSSSQTLDQLAKEIMTPYIHDWLEKNLPKIIEEKLKQTLKGD